MIVFSEASPQLAPSASARDILTMSEAAQLVGAHVFSIPDDFSSCGGADAALAWLPEQPAMTPALWIGYIPTPERYNELYEAALTRNIRLVNTLEEHQNAQEMDRALPLLGELTPATAFITAPEQARVAAEKLGYPVFVKGAVQSRKARGWQACVAESPEHLERLCTAVLSLEARSRGRVAIRRLLKLRYVRMGPGDFPLGREFRYFVLNGEILAGGYYWEGDDPLAGLTRDEENAVQGLVREAAERIKTPYLTVDVGQDESGQWWVIETGDAQFSGLSQTPRLTLWHQLQLRHPAR